MNRAGSVLQGILRKHDIGRISELGRLLECWEAEVGEPVASHASPTDLRNRILTVVVDSPVWIQQLSFLKNDLLGRLAPYHVDEIVFRPGKPGRPTRPKPLPPPLAPRKIDRKDRTYIKQTLETVSDDRLKASFEKILNRSFSVPAKRKKKKDSPS